MAGKPGKTAPRLLQDLLTYDPRHEQRAGRNLLAASPPLHDPDVPARAAVSTRNCRHDFVTKHEQSQLPQPGEAPGVDTVYKIASICSKCRWHYDVVVDYRNAGSSNERCRRVHSERPLHHFVFEGEEGLNELALGRTQTKPRTFEFRCSAKTCPVSLRIRVTPPRFSDADRILLTDRGTLRRRWEAAKQIAGERADTSMARPVDAPDFLSTYLQDSLSPQKGKSRIPFLNRKFLKTFGRDCDDLLRRLGFTSSEETEDDGSTVHVWHLPRPPPPGNILDATESEDRNMVEDARYELNAMLLDFPEHERSGARHVPVKHLSSRSLLEKALGCDDYDKVKGRVETRSTNFEEDHPYYAGLGAVGDFADQLLLFAYHRQVATDEMNAPYYFECVQDLAVGRRSEELQSNVAILKSEGCFTRREVASAYRSFGIDPSHSTLISDEHITGTFRSRLVDIGPSMIEETRRQLRIIGHARGSDTIKRAASDDIETYEQALSWLDLDKDQPDDFVVAMFGLKKNDSPGSEETASKAVRVIARHRGSQRLLDFLETGSLEGVEMQVAEAYALLGITNRAEKLDLQVLHTVAEAMAMDHPEMKVKYEEAFAKVEHDQKDSFGKGPAKETYPLATWPVGCSNIGNTCYLNSVLQFLFTVKPLRDRVLDCENFMQELSPEALATKRVGRTAVSLARAETGQQFVRELRKLFDIMINAPRDNIRPERTLATLALTRGESFESSAVDNKANDKGLGEIGGEPVSGPALPPDGLQGSGPPTPADSVMGDTDAKSDTNSMKAMDLTASANEVHGAAAEIPQPPSRAPPIPPRPQPSADSGFKKIEEVARQQDAAEILNNVFDLLSCAFRAESTSRDGEQHDLIKKLFFSDVTTVRNTKGKIASKSDLQDNVHVSTKDRDRTICAALDDEFGLTELEDGVTKFEFFEQASPIQIINVRRLQFENGKPRKDESHFTLDKRLYLDRYLKETASHSKEQLQALRNEQWRLQTELRALEGRRKSLKETDFEKVDLPDALDEAASFSQKVAADMPGVISAPSEHESHKLVDQLRQRADELRPDIAEIDGRMDSLEKEIDTVFEGCADLPYRLHSIFIHAGSHSGGHYWIYIYDFQNNVWRSYNDETVSKVTEEEVLKKVQRDHPPTSTGIVYVREDIVNEYTQAVCRKPESTETQNGHADVEMKDLDADSQHVNNTNVEYKNLEVINGVALEDSPPVELVEDVERGEERSLVSARIFGKRRSESPAKSSSPDKRSRLDDQDDGNDDASDMNVMVSPPQDVNLD